MQRPTWLGPALVLVLSLTVLGWLEWTAREGQKAEVAYVESGRLADVARKLGARSRAAAETAAVVKRRAFALADSVRQLSAGLRVATGARVEGQPRIDTVFVDTGAVLGQAPAVAVPVPPRLAALVLAAVPVVDSLTRAVNAEHAARVLAEFARDSALASSDSARAHRPATGRSFVAGVVVGASLVVIAEKLIAGFIAKR